MANQSLSIMFLVLILQIIIHSWNKMKFRHNIGTTFRLQAKLIVQVRLTWRINLDFSVGDDERIREITEYHFYIFYD